MRTKKAAKKWYESKTVWLNAVTFIAGLLALIQVTPDLLPADYTPWIVLALSVCNLALRLITGTPIAGTPADTHRPQASGGGAPE